MIQVIPKMELCVGETGFIFVVNIRIQLSDPGPKSFLLFYTLRQSRDDPERQYHYF